MLSWVETSRRWGEPGGICRVVGLSRGLGVGRDRGWGGRPDFVSFIEFCIMSE
jgi:hypothetical protein